MQVRWLTTVTAGSAARACTWLMSRTDREARPEDRVPAILADVIDVDDAGTWTQRASLVAEAAKLGAKAAGRRSAQHVVALLDGKWYRAFVEIVSGAAELAGEVLKWADWSVGYLSGSVVGAASKVVPLGYKLFNWMWQTANDWGGTMLWGGKTTAQLKTDHDQLVNVIVGGRGNSEFTRLLCEIVGIEPREAHNRQTVEAKVLQFAA